MTPAEYYVTTLTTAFGKLIPAVAFIVIGYFIFFKLPFLFLLKNMTNYKRGMSEDRRGVETFKKEFSQDGYEDFKRRMKIIGAPQKEKKEEKIEGRKGQEKQEKSERAKKQMVKPSSAEVIFDIQPGQPISRDELKKRYHELLRMNHPDKVAALGPDFRTLAEKKTKEINEAYSKLKLKVC